MEDTGKAGEVVLADSPNLSNKKVTLERISAIFASQTTAAGKASELEAQLAAIQFHLSEREIRRLMRLAVFSAQPTISVSSAQLADIDTDENSPLLNASHKTIGFPLFLSLAPQITEKNLRGGYRFPKIVNALRDVAVEEAKKSLLPANSEENVYRLFRDMFFGQFKNYSTFWLYQRRRYRPITNVLKQFLNSQLQHNPSDANYLADLEKFSPEIIKEILTTNNLYDRFGDHRLSMAQFPKLVRAIDECFTPDVQRALDSKNAGLFRGILMNVTPSELENAEERDVVNHNRITMLERYVRQIILRYQSARRPRNFWENRLEECLKQLMNFVGEDEKLPLDSELLKQSLAIINNYYFKGNIKNLLTTQVNNRSLNFCMQKTLSDQPGEFARFTKVTKVVPQISAVIVAGGAVPRRGQRQQAEFDAQAAFIEAVRRCDVRQLRELISRHNVEINPNAIWNKHTSLAYLISEAIKYKDDSMQSTYLEAIRILLTHPRIQVASDDALAAKEAELPKEIFRLLRSKAPYKLGLTDSEGEEQQDVLGTPPASSSVQKLAFGTIDAEEEARLVPAMTGGNHNNTYSGATVTVFAPAGTLAHVAAAQPLVVKLAEGETLSAEEEQQVRQAKSAVVEIVTAAMPALSALPPKGKQEASLTPDEALEKLRVKAGQDLREIVGDARGALYLEVSQLICVAGSKINELKRKEKIALCARFELNADAINVCLQQGWEYYLLCAQVLSPERIEFVRMLLQKGVDPVSCGDSKTPYHTPLFYAVAVGNFEALQCLYANDPRKATAFVLAHKTKLQEKIQEERSKNLTNQEIYNDIKIFLDRMVEPVATTLNTSTVGSQAVSTSTEIKSIEQIIGDTFVRNKFDKLCAELNTKLSTLQNEQDKLRYLEAVLELVAGKVDSMMRKADTLLFLQECLVKVMELSALCEGLRIGPRVLVQCLTVLDKYCSKNDIKAFIEKKNVVTVKHGKDYTMWSYIRRVLPDSYGDIFQKFKPYLTSESFDEIKEPLTNPIAWGVSWKILIGEFSVQQYLISLCHEREFDQEIAHNLIRVGANPLQMQLNGCSFLSTAMEQFAVGNTKPWLFYVGFKENNVAAILDDVITCYIGAMLHSEAAKNTKTSIANACAKVLKKLIIEQGAIVTPQMIRKVTALDLPAELGTEVLYALEPKQEEAKPVVVAASPAAAVDAEPASTEAVVEFGEFQGAAVSAEPVAPPAESAVLLAAAQKLETQDFKKRITGEGDIPNRLDTRRDRVIEWATSGKKPENADFQEAIIDPLMKYAERTENTSVRNAVRANIQPVLAEASVSVSPTAEPQITEQPFVVAQPEPTSESAAVPASEPVASVVSAATPAPVPAAEPVIQKVDEASTLKPLVAEVSDVVLAQEPKQATRPLSKAPVPAAYNFDAYKEIIMNARKQKQVKLSTKLTSDLEGIQDENTRLAFLQALIYFLAKTSEFQHKKDVVVGLIKKCIVQLALLSNPAKGLKLDAQLLLDCLAMINSVYNEGEILAFVEEGNMRSFLSNISTRDDLPKFKKVLLSKLNAVGGNNNNNNNADAVVVVREPRDVLAEVIADLTEEDFAGTVRNTNDMSKRKAEAIGFVGEGSYGDISLVVKQALAKYAARTNNEGVRKIITDILAEAQREAEVQEERVFSPQRATSEAIVGSAVAQRRLSGTLDSSAAAERTAQAQQEQEQSEATRESVIGL